MAQESISDFMEIARDYAKAEKELEVQHWVYIGIERKDANGNRVRIFSYDLPREVYERRNWVLANPVMFPEPITDVKGKLSFWDYDGELP